MHLVCFLFLLLLIQHVLPSKAEIELSPPQSNDEELVVLSISSLPTDDVIHQYKPATTTSVNIPPAHPHLRRATRDTEDEPDPRIVGGSDAELGAYPHMVAALYRRKYFFCGGTLVARNVVLLAGHCSNYIDRVLIGRQDLSVRDETEELFDIVEIARHPEFEWDNPPRNDYVLARLSGSSTRKPISLDDGSIIEKFAPNQELVMLGWGQTSRPGPPLSYKLQEGRIDYVTNDDCTTNFWGGDKISDEMVCGYREGVSGCLGDSGGPLLWNREDDPVIVGVLSWGARKCSGYATVFAGVGNQASWIISTVNAWSMGEACISYTNKDICQQDTFCTWNIDNSGCISAY
uniref:Peptidase S1 domain-containing protein n=1 Tax=Leptocylindrus danicus TaxID=163516 RepID=A0A7S2PIX6_9STRA|mmetsp:Transcript_3782/g.5487  ORF Transcript_3782/g.5487 Transcript_3782/m.5487 type:complete len:347 (+) Transcript_3782:211-1251(+)